MFRTKENAQISSSCRYRIIQDPTRYVWELKIHFPLFPWNHCHLANQVRFHPLTVMITPFPNWLKTVGWRMSWLACNYAELSQSYRNTLSIRSSPTLKHFFFSRNRKKKRLSLGRTELLVDQKRKKFKSQNWIESRFLHSWASRVAWCSIYRWLQLVLYNGVQLRIVYS